MGFRKYLSKDRFSLRQVAGMLTLVIVGVSVLAYAAVTIPYTFTSGTTAKSSEVNANFQALADAMNNRTSATLANMAGTWNYTMNGYGSLPSSTTLCTMSRTGTLTLNADGTFSDNQADTNTICQNLGVQANPGGTYTGTWSVSAAGSGALTYSSGAGTLSFQASRDLNTMVGNFNIPSTPYTTPYDSVGTITYLRQ